MRLLNDQIDEIMVASTDADREALEGPIAGVRAALGFVTVASASVAEYFRGTIGSLAEDTLMAMTNDEITSLVAELSDADIT